MIQPKISVVTVCYNAVKDIEKTILSVVNQTYPNIEYIIIDGGSKDGTMNVVNRYKDKIDVIVSEPDKGIYDAMNKGIDRATGEWINFMNAGDCFEGENIVSQVFVADIDKCKSVLYGDVKLKTKGVTTAKPLKYLRCMMPFCHQSTFVKLPMEKYDTNYRIVADYKLFSDYYYYKGNACFEYVPVTIAVFDDVEGVSSVQKKKMEDETLTVIASHSSCWYVYYNVKTVLARLLKK